MKNKNILVVAAHPDDEILGCGGTIAKLTSNNNVFVLILGEGITSRDSNTSQIKVKELRDAAMNAHRILGIKESYFEEFPDNSFDKIPLLDIIKKVEQYIKKVNPDTIFTHHNTDLNVDHRLTFQAVLTCCRPQPNFHHPDLYCFEIPSSTEWQVLTGETIFKPNVFINISDTIDDKLKVLELYDSEIRQYPHSRSLKGIKIMAQDWGRKIGIEYAEAFELIRSIRDNL